MSLQLLTGREVIKTHRHWRLMMKRAVWSAHSALRKVETQSLHEPPAENQILASVVLESGNAARLSGNNAYYDDWLHRGSWEPIRAMNHYVYGMYVDVVDNFTATLRDLQSYPFSSHYAKSGTHVQILLRAPRIPFLHGITLPSRAADIGTNALMQQCLCRPTSCDHASCCRNPAAHSKRYIATKSNGYHGTAAGVMRFVEPWRVYEAHLQVLAARADQKLTRARRCACLTDVSTQRQWYMPGAMANTMVQQWLLPWLCGFGRHCYLAPWYTHVSRWQQNAQINRIGFLQPLPMDVACSILRYVGHVKYDEDTQAPALENIEEPRLLLVANSEDRLSEARTNLKDCRRAEVNSPQCYEIDNLPYTSLGVHDDQLTPDEFCALVTTETSAHWDLMAEARRRPRPSQLYTDEVLAHEDDLGMPTVQAEVGDVQDYAQESAGDVPDEVKKSSLCPGVRYRALMRVPDDDLLDTVHRLRALDSMDKRSGDKYERIKEFMKHHRHEYQHIKEQRTVHMESFHNHKGLSDHRGRTPSQSQQLKADLQALQLQNQLQEDRRKLEMQMEDAPEESIFPTMGPSGEEELQSTDARPVDVLMMPPAEYARSLVAKRLPAPSDTADTFQIPKDQYDATMLCIEPLQRLWKQAAADNKLHIFQSRSDMLSYLSTIPETMVRRMFFHGPGGSGKTYFVNEVVLPTYKKYCPNATRAFAARNSAARLIGGATFHYMGSLLRQQVLTRKKPSPKLIQKLQLLWSHLALALIDEISLVDPQLLAVVNDRCCWGRNSSQRVDPEDFCRCPFGNILMQMLLGDFMQLNPTMSHSLLETFLRGTSIEVPRAPKYEKFSNVERQAKEDLNNRGYQIFDVFAQSVILFQGSHRFIKGDPLPQLLNIMRTIGGATVPNDLRALVVERIVRPSAQEVRTHRNYIMHDENNRQIGPRGFFAQGFHSAINWEAVSRFQQLWAANAACVSAGPTAYRNTQNGKPQKYSRWKCTYVSTMMRTICDIPAVADRLQQFLQHIGQLIFYIQAVDISHVRSLQSVRSLYTQALATPNMSSHTAGMMGILPCFLGMSYKLTKKIMAPELVQEAPLEAIDITFHDSETFGLGHTHNQNKGPPPDHPCSNLSFSEEHPFPHETYCLHRTGFQHSPSQNT